MFAGGRWQLPQHGPWRNQARSFSSARGAHQQNAFSSYSSFSSFSIAGWSWPTTRCASIGALDLVDLQGLRHVGSLLVGAIGAQNRAEETV